jgi:hypothetical protein
MAKTTTFGAVNTALVQGAGAAYKDYSTDSFNKANQAITKLFEAKQSKEKAEKEKIQNSIQASVAEIGDVDISKTPPEQRDAQFAALNDIRGNVANLENQKHELINKYGLPPNSKEVLDIVNQISQSKQQFSMISKDAETFQAMRQEFINNGGQYSKGVPIEVQDKLDKLFAKNGQYTTEIVNGRQVYKTEDGTVITNEDLQKGYFLKDSKMATYVMDGVDKIYSKGSSGKGFTNTDEMVLGQSIKNEILAGGAERVASMLHDDIFGLNIDLFTDAETAALEALPFEDQVNQITTKLVDHYKNVYNDGKKEYNSKQSSGGKGSFKSVDGSIPFISTRNQGDFIWYEEFGGYGPGLPNPETGGIMKDTTLTKDKVISDPDALNTIAVGLGDIKFGK